MQSKKKTMKNLNKNSWWKEVYLLMAIIIWVFIIYNNLVYGIDPSNFQIFTVLILVILSKSNK